MFDNLTPRGLAVMLVAVVLVLALAYGVMYGFILLAVRSII